MIVFIVLLSFACLALSLFVPGYFDLVLLAGPCLLASLWLWWRAPRRRASSRWGAPSGQVGTPKRSRQTVFSRRHVIIDGSNVMHWVDGKPSLDPVIAVVRRLAADGLTPGVMFDANAGYKTHDRYQDDAEMARRLGLPTDRVLVVPKGVQADQYILKAARNLGARVVTNDRFRDWQADFPEVAQPGFLIRGGVTQGKPWFDGPL